MRNKQVIEQLTEKTTTVVDFLYKDITSGKPHITAEYVQEQLGFALRNLETIQQYLNLED